MSSVQRAAWAGQVPATGIIGVIPAANLPPASAGVTDIGGLKAAGFTDGMVPVWSSARNKFIPMPYSVSDGTSGGLNVEGLSLLVTWSGATLRPLESTESLISIPAVTMGSKVFVEAPGAEYVFYTATVFNAPVVSVKATNMSPDVVALVDAVYQFWVIT